MAFRDYIICGQCETKIIYDGYNNGRDRLEEIWGDPNADVWTVRLLCPDCLKKLQADLAAARALLQEMRDARFLAWQSSPEGRAYLARIDAALAKEV